MATVPGLMRLNRTAAANMAAAQATGFMLFAVTAPNTGYQEINDEEDAGLMQMQTVVVDSLMRLAVNS